MRQSPVQTSNSTDASFPSRVPTTTAPALSATRAVLSWTSQRSSLVLTPFGKNANNLNFKVRVIGWAQTDDGVWYPTLLCEFTATLSSSLTGVAAKTPDNNNLFADTIAVNDGVAVVLSSRADDTAIASVEIPVGSEKDNFDYVEVCFNRNASATECNALWAAY